MTASSQNFSLWPVIGPYASLPVHAHGMYMTWSRLRCHVRSSAWCITAACITCVQTSHVMHAHACMHRHVDELECTHVQYMLTMYACMSTMHACTGV
ncbi:TPA: hypothetical protein ACH3X1_008694 [Trebouxia sp. C0004]